MRMSERDRARGALLGLAIGDSLGLPADFHRSVRHAWSRGALWRGSAALDDQSVSRPLLPFSVTLDGIRGVVPTDDTETAAVAALVLLGDPGDLDALFEGWLEHFAADGVWCGIAARSALAAAALGSRPPVTGNDNPAHYDDSAVPAGVSIGVAFHGRPAEASALAGSYASISNAEDGIWGCQWMAVAVAALVAGAGTLDALDEADRVVPSDTWLADNMSIAREIADRGPDPFSALPELIGRLSPRNYSHGGAAPETVPLAAAIVRLATVDPGRAIPLALSIARQSDSLPALVGALCGAASGATAFGERWRTEVGTVGGVLIPSTAGLDLRELADRLHDLRPQEWTT